MIRRFRRARRTQTPRSRVAPSGGVALTLLLCFSPLVLTAAAHGAENSAQLDCCPGELNQDQRVDEADLAILLGSWGCSTCGDADLNGSGVVDATDLGLLLLDWGTCDPPCPVWIHGVVIGSDGTPVANATVTTERGGTTSSAWDGAFHLHIFPSSLESPLHVTAISDAAGPLATGELTIESLPFATELVVGPITVESANLCIDDPIPTFGGIPGTDREVVAIARFDDGDNPRWFVAGDFSSAGGMTAPGLAAWNGRAWESVADSLDGTIFRLRVVDDGLGGGPALYACGHFSSIDGVASQSLARWSPWGWQSFAEVSLADGSSGFVTEIIARPNGGVVIGGHFSSVAGVACANIAEWDGQRWSPLGTGIGGDVWSLCYFDEPSRGTGLFAAGMFGLAGDVPAKSIARWDGAGWTTVGTASVGGGTWPYESTIQSLAVYDEGTGAGPMLFAGGDFPKMDGMNIKRLARWDGTTWSAVGANSIMGNVASLTVAHSELYAAGGFEVVDGMALGPLARWDGSAWSAVDRADLIADIYTVAIDESRGRGDVPNMIIGGSILSAGGRTTRNIAALSDDGWHALGQGLNDPINLVVPLDTAERAALFGTPYDASAAPPILVSGTFTHDDPRGEATTVGLAIWNGRSFQPIPDSPLASVLTWGVEEGEPVAYLGGTFTSGDGASTKGVRRWNGRTWSPLGGSFDGSLNDLVLFDRGQGAGPELHVTGAFSHAGSVAVSGIARWDGQAWQPLGAGIGNGKALAVFDHDGDGHASLFVGGKFWAPGGTILKNIARWDGTTWHTVGGGFQNGDVRDLAVFDDGLGAGPRLFAAGQLTSTSGIARLVDGTWKFLTGSPDLVARLATREAAPPGARSLYLVGRDDWNSLEPDYVWEWNGATLKKLTSTSGETLELGGEVVTLTTAPAPGGISLFLGGDFTHSSLGDSHLAHWGCANDQ